MKRSMLVLLLGLVFAFIAACGEADPSFSLLADKDVFQQNLDEVNTKIDILWVIDNSGSMDTSQAALISNFEEFIDGFRDRNYDFKMAVTTTDGYKSMFAPGPPIHGGDPWGAGDPLWSKFRDGTDATSHTGVFVVTPETPNFEDVFLVNVLQGIDGTGDERAFSSFKQAFDNSLNSGFVRPDSFVAVIMVSDEDDFSHDDTFFTNDYGYAGLHTPQSYADYLDGLTSSIGEYKRYSVSAMGIWDEPCRLALADEWPGRKIGVRMGELVDLTGGEKGSLCDNFADTLDLISEGIIQLATEFFLTRIPVPETITVKINGVLIAEVADPENPANGWLYNADKNSITFYGTAIPPQGATIEVDFDPESVGQ